MSTQIILRALRRSVIEGEERKKERKKITDIETNIQISLIKL